MTFNETWIDWLTTFWKILISPTPGTMRKEAEKATDKFPSAVAWLVFFAVYLFTFYTLVVKQLFIAGLIMIVLALPLSVILATSAMHFIQQRIYKRKQYLYDKFLYLTVAIVLPVQILYTPLSAILLVTSQTTIGNVLGYAVLLYQAVLLVIAVKAVTKLAYSEATIIVVVSMIAAALVFLCTIPVMFSIMGGVNSTLR